MNAQYDLLYLRTLPDLRPLLDGGHLCLDLSVLNYLECEIRPEKSLKNLGPVLRTHTYDRTLEQKFPHPDDAGHSSYQVQDTHNTMLAAQELVRRIRNQKAPNKLSEFTLRMYSDTIWSCVRMSEAGIPFSITKLQALESHLNKRIKTCVQVAKERFGLTLEGEGSHLSKASLIDLVIQTIDGELPCQTLPPSITADGTTTPLGLSTVTAPAASLDLGGCTTPSSSSSSSVFVVSSPRVSVRSNPLLQLTDKTQQISFSEENRRLLSGLLDSRSPLHSALKLWERHSRAQKLLSTYVFPLLHHKRNDPGDQKSRVFSWTELQPLSYLGLLPEPASLLQSSSISSMKETGLAFPTWFITPTPSKDTSDDNGGTLQGRITCKNPPAQTFPPAIQGCIRSRWGVEGCILSMDLSQIELRVPTLISGDKVLVEEYAKAKPDLHTRRAIEVFGPGVVNTPGFKSGDMRVDHRQWGKTLNFADLFLAKPPRMQETILELSGILMPLSFFEEIYRNRYRNRSGLMEWQFSLAEAAERDGRLILPLTGQSREFPGFRINRQKWTYDKILQGRKSAAKDMISEVVNFPVQTTAGNTMLRIQAQVHKLMPHINYFDPPIRLFLNVYDALKFDVKKTFLEEAKAIIKSAVEYVQHKEYWSYLQERYGRTVPLIYELKVH